MTNELKNPETIALHAGWRSDASTNSVAVPIHQTTSYQFDNTEHASNLFALSELGNIYSRIMNPTCDILEQRVAALEGGAAALAVSSGQTATAYAIQNIARAGDNIVSSTDLYGGTWNQFSNTFKDIGIEVRFVDPKDPNDFANATDDKTRAYFAETLPNPKLQVFPIKEVADIGRKLGIPLIVDNTAAPIICRPFDHGAAIIIHSTTKYIGGHGTSIGGIIVDAGGFDWAGAGDRQPALNTPDPSYHGAVFSQLPDPLTPLAFILKARTTLLRDMGGAMSPFNAFQFIQGLETLSVRIKKHSENALKVAQWLESQKEVAWVNYPGLESSKYFELSKKYLKDGQSGVVTFGLKKGFEGGKKLTDSTKIFSLLANFGDSKSLIIHPASTTHQQLSEEEQKQTGVTSDLIRLSIGLEDPNDLINDLSESMKRI